MESLSLKLLSANHLSTVGKRILDTRFNPPIVRPLHIEESSRLMEAPDGELGLYMKLNLNADLEELSRFVGWDGRPFRRSSRHAYREEDQTVQARIGDASRQPFRNTCPSSRAGSEGAKQTNQQGRQ